MDSMLDTEVTLIKRDSLRFTGTLYKIKEGLYRVVKDNDHVAFNLRDIYIFDIFTGHIVIERIA